MPSRRSGARPSADAIRSLLRPPRFRTHAEPSHMSLPLLCVEWIPARPPHSAPTKDRTASLPSQSHYSPASLNHRPGHTSPTRSISKSPSSTSSLISLCRCRRRVVCLAMPFPLFSVSSHLLLLSLSTQARHDQTLPLGTPVDRSAGCGPGAPMPRPLCISFCVLLLCNIGLF